MIPHYIVLPCSLVRLLLVVTDSHILLILMTLVFLRTVQVFCRMFLNWSLPDVLIISLKFGIWGRKATEVEWYFHYIVSRVYTIDLTRVARLVRKVTTLIPNQATCLGCRFGPGGGRAGGYPSMCLCYIKFLSLLFPLSKNK